MDYETAVYMASVLTADGSARIVLRQIGSQGLWKLCGAVASRLCAEGRDDAGYLRSRQAICRYITELRDLAAEYGTPCATN